MSDMTEFLIVTVCIAQATLSVLMTVLIVKSEHHYRHLASVIHHKETHSAGKNFSAAGPSGTVHPDQMTLWCECNKPHEHHEPIGG